MQVVLSYRETAMVVAALKAFHDPVSFLGNGAGEALFVKYGRLTPPEVDYLIRRLALLADLPAGDRTTPTSTKH